MVLYGQICITHQRRDEQLRICPDLEKKREERFWVNNLEIERKLKRTKARQIDQIRKSFHRQRKLNAAREFSSRKLAKECETEIEVVFVAGIVVKDEVLAESSPKQADDELSKNSSNVFIVSG